MGWVGLGRVGSHKMDPWTTLGYTTARLSRRHLITQNILSGCLSSQWLTMGFLLEFLHYISRDVSTV